MSASIFLDTNILLYSISTEPAEQPKKAAALRLLGRIDAGVSVQVLQEFYVQATRPTRTDRLPHELAVGLIHSWTRFAVQPVTLEVLTAAFDIKQRYRLSYWDSAIVAAARLIGCQELYSEDMGHGTVLDGVRLINPFL